MDRCKRHVGAHHGMYGTPTYKSWYCMKYRCGKKGTPWEKISYCEEWADFRNFFKDMGVRPEGTSLDRIDVYGNYCKENCRWATREVQNNNKTNNHKCLVDGNYYTLNQLARKYGIKRTTLEMRINRNGWSIEKALFTPVKSYRTRQQGGR